MPWKVAIVRVAIVETLLVSIVVITGSGFIPGFNGADNPLWSYVAVILQFPAVALAPLVLYLGPKVLSQMQTAYLAAFLVAVGEFAFLVVMFRYASRACKWKPRGPTSA